jgi:hypothetical protein
VAQIIARINPARREGNVYWHRADLRAPFGHLAFGHLGRFGHLGIWDLGIWAAFGAIWGAWPGQVGRFYQTGSCLCSALIVSRPGLAYLRHARWRGDVGCNRIIQL